MMDGWIPPQWTFDLEREIMDAPRERLAKARQELIDAGHAEAQAFDKFKREYDRRMKDDAEAVQ